MDNDRTSPPYEVIDGHYYRAPNAAKGDPAWKDVTDELADMRKRADYLNDAFNAKCDEVERMRPVVEAAADWREGRMPTMGRLQSRSDLARAVDTYRAASSEPEDNNE